MSQKISKLTKQEFDALKPFLLKFTNLIDDIEKGDIKKIPRKIKDFQTSKQLKKYPAYLKVANATFELKKGDYEKANILIREAVDEKVPEKLICNNIVQILKACSDTEYLSNIYQFLVDQFPEEVEYLLADIVLHFTTGDVKKAQELCMKLVQFEKGKSEDRKSVSFIFAAFCSYARAKGGEAPFYRMAAMFIDKINKQLINLDTAKIKFLSLLKSGDEKQYSAALEYLNSEEIAKIFKADPIEYARLRIDAERLLGHTQSIGEIAADLLNTINPDMLDEWKLAVQYHPDIDKLINHHNNGLYRGPQLARIELALHKKEDPAPLILEYAQKYAQKPHLLGDLKPYLTPEVLNTLKSVQDPAIQCLINNKFDDSYVTTPNEATVNMKAQQLMRQNNRQGFLDAVATLAEYAENPTSRILLIRLSGLLNATVGQNKLWSEQHLENIQYLSLLSLYINELSHSWDLETLRKMTKLSRGFYSKGISQFPSYVNAAFNNYNFFAAEMSVQFYKSIQENIGRYLIDIYDIWLNILDDPEQITPYKYRKIMGLNDIDKLEERIDESVFPLYFQDQTLHDLLFPSVKPLTKLVSAATRVLFAMKLDTANLPAVLAELESVAQGNQWQIFIDFVKGGCKSIEFNKDGIDALILGSIAIAAEVSNSPADIKTKISQQTENVFTATLESLKLDELPDVLKSINQEQVENMSKGKETILNLLK